MSNREKPFGKNSYPFAVGRIKAVEGSLLDRSKWNRLLDGDVEQAMQALREFGYGADAQEHSLDGLIRQELRKAALLIAEVTPDQELTDLFLLPTDGHNLKVLLKSRLLSEESDSLLQEGGSIPIDWLKACVEHEDFSLLGPVLEQQLSGIFSVGDPRLLSAAVDNAVYTKIWSVLETKNNSLLRRYFTARAAYINLLSRMRAERLGWDEQAVVPMLIPIKFQTVDQPEAGSTVMNTQSRMNRKLMEIVREEKNDSFGIGPIVCYLLDKQAEARNLRVLFAAKRSGRPISEADLDL